MPQTFRPHLVHPARRFLPGVETLECRTVPTAGFLDPGFGGTGVVTTNVGQPTAPEQAWDLAVYNGVGSDNLADGRSWPSARRPSAPAAAGLRIRTSPSSATPQTGNWTRHSAPAGW